MLPTEVAVSVILTGRQLSRARTAQANLRQLHVQQLYMMWATLQMHWQTMTPSFLPSRQCRDAGHPGCNCPSAATNSHNTARSSTEEKNTPARTHLTSSRYCLKRSPS